MFELPAVFFKIVMQTSQKGENEEAVGGGGPDEADSAYQQASSQFIHFWGEMASSWGVNRTMAQVHALLYTSERPLDMDEIMAQLQISRGSVSMNLRSLTSWNLVEKVQQAGSRRDYYTAKKDVWDITAQIIKERERREIQPVRQQLRACRDLLLKESGADACEELEQRERVLCQRIDNLLQLVDVFEGVFRTLLPFVQQRNLQQVKQFIAFAEALQGQLEGED